MKNLFYIITTYCLLISTISYSQVHVKGYYRKDGTYVKPHYRSNPDGNPYNNWSYPGNTNPYTGKTATGNTDTYLNNYNNKSNNSYSANAYGGRRNLYYVKSNNLNVRSGTSTNYSIIGTLSYYSEVEVLETYTNGWNKIRYYNYNTPKEGYVHGNYIGAKTSGFLNDAPNTRITTMTDPQFQTRSVQKNGFISIWTDCGYDGYIKIYLDGKYIGSLSSHFSSGKPQCGDSGTLTLEKPSGVYRIKAKSNNFEWDGNIEVAGGYCTTKKIEKP